MHTFSCVFSEMTEFSKILGKIFGEEEHRVPKYFLLWGKWSWQGVKYLALSLWPPGRVPITLAGLRVIHLDEKELRKQKISFKNKSHFVL